MRRKHRVLLEMRPALGGHAGIPQATRLLFRHLAALETVDLEGLLQTSATVLAPGLPPSGTSSLQARAPDEDLNVLGKVILSLERPSRAPYLHVALMTLAMYAKRALGHRQQLSRLPAGYFKDYLWRRLFEKTLAAQEFSGVGRAAFRVARIPWTAMHSGALIMRRLGCELYLRLDTSHFDFMVSETPYPADVSKKTRLIVRYHDAIPILMPHTISSGGLHQAFHYHALRRNVAAGAWFACVSRATRDDLLSIFPQVERRSIVIPNIVSNEYFVDPAPMSLVNDIIEVRHNDRLGPRPTSHRRLPGTPGLRKNSDFFLMVSTIEPRKNHLNILTAWERLRSEHPGAPQLVIVGDLGWRHEAIIERFKPWLARREVFLISNLLTSELRVLYRNARATLCPSLGEGFDYSGVEAMRCGGVVLASDIAVHREVYGNAAIYFDPYDVPAITNALRIVMQTPEDNLREAMNAEGFRVSAQYESKAVVPQWESLFEQLRPQDQ